MAGGNFKFGKPVAAMVAVLILFSMVILLISGCGQSLEQKQKQYKSEWTRIMDEFEARVASDDKKAQSMIASGDTAGVIKLLEKRIENVWDVYGEIVVLYPSAELRNLHALTLYYLTCVVDQLEAQNDLNEAILSGKPTGDLKTISDQANQKSSFIISELALEVEKAGIELKSMKEEKKKTGPEVQEKQNQGTVP